MGFLINPYAHGGGGDPTIDPESVGNLIVWFDPDDASSRVEGGGVVTQLDNKAAVDTGNVARADDNAANAAGMFFAAAQWAGRDMVLSNHQPDNFRVLSITNNTQTITETGTDAFRVFYVCQAPSGTLGDVRGRQFFTGAGDPSGGGVEIWNHINTGGDNTLRFRMYDTDNAHVVDIDLAAVNHDLFDGDAHIVMIGREKGTPDQLVVSIDGVRYTANATDMGQTSNPGTTNAAAGWWILGAVAAAPDTVQVPVPWYFGELLAYRTDLTTTTEDQVIAHLANRWGITL